MYLKSAFFFINQTHFYVKSKMVDDSSEQELKDDSDSELDFSEHWQHVTIHRKVLQGVKLREKKYRPPTEKREYNVLDIISPSSSHKQSRRAKKNGVKSSAVPFDMSEDERHEALPKIVKDNRRRKRKRQCHVRVMELASPSKRYCLNTWRERYETLPSYMVDRLKQIVMDQKPIVKVSDAIDCFKYQNKKNKSTTSHQTGKKSISTKKDKQDIHLYSAVLQLKVIKRLLPLVAIDLCPRLENVYKIVKGDMILILNKRKDPNKLLENQEMLSDTAKKVTLWIADVLEQSTDRLLMEDLKELEEKEGPVLDLIDEIINNVVQLETESEHSANSNNSTESKSSVLCEENESLESVRSNRDVEIQPLETESSNQIIKNILSELIKSNVIQEYIFSKDSETLDAKDELVSDNSNKNHAVPKDDVNINNVVKYIDIEADTQQFDTDEDTIVQDIENNDISTIEKNVTNENINNFTVEDKKTVKNDDLPTLNVIVIEQDNLGKENDELTPEETAEDSLKKVKFYNFNMGVNEEIRNIAKQAEETLMINENLENIKNLLIDNNAKSLIVFAPANPLLLNPADEIWPEDLSTSLRPSASVNKSIASLGRITETDERVVPPSSNLYTYITREDGEENLKTWAAIEARASIETNVIYGDNIREKKVGIPNGNLCDSNKDDIETKIIRSLSNLNQPLSSWQRNKTNEEMGAIDGKIITPISSTNVLYSKNESAKLDEIYSSFTKNKHELNHGNKHKLDASNIRPDYINTDSRTFEEIYKMISSRKQKKMITKHLPTISINSEYSLKGADDRMSQQQYHNKGSRHRSSEHDPRQWCLGLQNVCQNLELWANWIENVTNHISCLKEKGDGRPQKRTVKSKEWRYLKADVDCDSVLWLNMSRKLQSSLGRYRTYKYHVSSRCMCFQTN